MKEFMTNTSNNQKKNFSPRLVRSSFHNADSVVSTDSVDQICQQRICICYSWKPCLEWQRSPTYVCVLQFYCGERMIAKQQTFLLSCLATLRPSCSQQYFAKIEFQKNSTSQFSILADVCDWYTFLTSCQLNWFLSLQIVQEIDRSIESVHVNMVTFLQWVTQLSNNFLSHGKGIVSNIWIFVFLPQYRKALKRYPVSEQHKKTFRCHFASFWVLNWRSLLLLLNGIPLSSQATFCPASPGYNASWNFFMDNSKKLWILDTRLSPAVLTCSIEWN